MTPRPFEHDIAGQQVLVTGGAGFIGSNIAAALLDGNDVRVLDDLSSGRRENVPDGAELLVGDVRDEDALDAAMAGVDLVFHEAAVVSVARSTEAPLETTRTNVDATVRVLEQARTEDARVVFASSAAVYGPPAYVPVDESHPKEPTSPYGVSKLAADQYVRLYASLYDVPTVALRYFNAYGPGQPDGDYSGVIRTFVDQATAGEPITVHGDGQQTRDFVHIDDIVRANLRAATTPHVGEAFNVGTGDSVTVSKLAAHIQELAGSDSPIRTSDPRPGDIRHSCAETTDARTKLGFEATVSLADGLETVAGLGPAE
ncbi:NAD-dependent epimerase/dehydratase family protein [Halodesulfurarchaeum formicicum]|uniref:UDP-glucose 4-epimerase n=1 Tax=Halodesulfurarchaeum formicicum TaxID=1873524 RepID=A0A1J1ABD4_9EURY|nr:NAD-dependent epimerase/dehydratase family protein [Halodesulfurarchaeum formicicum]APE95112.1 UDP-glucose 4-epimerase [Halodesulfurarchaeum formicicum]